MKRTLLATLITFSFILPSFAAGLGVQGMWPSNESVEDNYQYYGQTTQSDIEGFIKTSNKNLGSTTISSIAESIITAASCYEIDPVYLAGLIRKESTFKTKARSKTGAAGLTQMTGVGIKELRDQLGYRGNSYARKTNIAYFKITTEKCLGDDWQTFKTLFYTKSNTEVKKAFYNNSKFSIFAGAILLKVYLANATKSCDMCSIPGTYRMALEQYNGDTHKVKYALKIQSYIDDWMSI